jgi:hypothetical protein
MKLALALIALLIIFAVIVYNFSTVDNECRKKHGTVIQGLNGFICIQQL